MLEIRPQSRYDVPCYPRGGYYTRPPKSTGTLLRGAAALTALAALLESCDDGGSTTGIPIPPKVVSEADARNAIDAVFADRAITLGHDQTVVIPTTPSDSSELNTDGFNDSLQVGYEYVSFNDNSWPSIEVEVHLDTAKFTQPPHLLIVPMEADDVGAEARLQQVVEDFLDSLAAHGVI